LLIAMVAERCDHRPTRRERVHACPQQSTAACLRVSATLFVAISAGACNAAPASGPKQTAAALPPPAVETNAPAPAAGTWTGTLTIHGVIDINKTENGSDGDPGSTYYDAYTKNDVTQTDVTDTFNISASDPEDLTFGIDQVDLGGSSANADV
jgi:hypothetical protein